MESKSEKREELIIFWDYENCPFPHNYTSGTVAKTLKEFCASFSKHFEAIASFNVDIVSYARGQELASIPGFQVISSFVPKRKKKRANATDMELKRIMMDKLFRTGRYTYVVMISGDGDFLLTLKQIQEENLKRKFILLYNGNPNREMVTDKMWLKSLPYKNLFLKVVPDHFEDKEVCKAFLEGKCKHGSDCSKLHPEKFLDPNYCWFFMKNGSCKNGDQCRRKHIALKSGEVCPPFPSKTVVIKSSKGLPPRLGTGPVKGCLNCGVMGHWPSECEWPCTAFVRGRCPNSECKFKHKIPEPRNLPVCQEYKNYGTCRRKECDKGHYSRIQCIKFLEGKCIHGNECRSLHLSFDSKGQEEEGMKTTFSESEVCKDFQKKCQAGKSCSKIHFKLL